MQGIPRVDRHIYARENGWAIGALATLYQVSGDRTYLNEAERAARWAIEHRSLEGGGFRHDEKDASGPYLGDTLAMTRAFLSLYTATHSRDWFERAQSGLEFIAANFRNRPARDMLPRETQKTPLTGHGPSAMKMPHWRAPLFWPGTIAAMRDSVE